MCTSTQCIHSIARPSPLVKELIQSIRPGPLVTPLGRSCRESVINQVDTSQSTTWSCLCVQIAFLLVQIAHCPLVSNCPMHTAIISILPLQQVTCLPATPGITNLSVTRNPQYTGSFISRTTTGAR
ncbi:hypothetical protein M0R45_025842 [Rubus argutus]|uniref:Uncharacterized protein n=1 Tax=Rubus argutus TaxID=59490 RepID=A0AAW1WVD1_RUBAR